MKKNNSIKFFLTILFIFFSLSNLKAEIIILSSCDNNKDGFLKNEYILDLEKSLMIRNYVYNSKTFKKYRVTDLSVKILLSSWYINLDRVFSFLTVKSVILYFLKVFEL